MADVCGPISLSSAGNLDFGTSAGTNCTTPGTGGLGNTHASRTGFFELNNLIQQAKGQLPNNPWIDEPLTANMNINLTCNAFWGGSSVNFYRQGGGCNNTGEIAAIFDHEWGHGMDDNDANGVISNPGEGIADIYMALRLKESCVGRNFRNTNCGGYGNACLACTGVRDIDWDQRASHPDHGLLDRCQLRRRPRPLRRRRALRGLGVCGVALGLLHPRSADDHGLQQRHCPRGGDAHHLHRGRLPVRAGLGRLPRLVGVPQLLGRRRRQRDGTPHMAALFSAFNRHGIACATPAVAVSGCANAPTTAPAVTPTAGDRGASLSWTSVPGAVKYRVYRTDGVFGCDFGKILLGETFGTTWSDHGLQNGRLYSYTVAAVGFSNTCLGPMSSCAQVTPAAGAANLSAHVAQASHAITTGDVDDFIDNCEAVNVTVPVTTSAPQPRRTSASRRCSRSATLAC